MSSRAVSADPKQAVAYAREFLAGLASAGVLGAAKHFPGLGEANLDTHHELPIRQEIVQEVVGGRYLSLSHDAPRVSHGADRTCKLSVRYPRPHPSLALAQVDHRCSCAKKFGYRGLILSDDLEMGGVLAAAPIERATVEHIRAGGDICLICHRADYINSAYEELIKEAERDRKFAARVEESSARVLAFKKKSTFLKRRLPAPARNKIERLSRQLWEFSEQVRLQSMVPQEKHDRSRRDEWHIR